MQGCIMKRLSIFYNQSAFPSSASQRVFLFISLALYCHTNLFCKVNPLNCLFCFPGVTTHCGCIFTALLAGFSLLVFEVSLSHTATRHSRQDSSGRVINPSQRPLPDNTQHSQQTDIHAPSGIRTHNLTRRAAEDLRLRPRGHWDRHPRTIL